MKRVGFLPGCNTAFNRPDNEQAIRFSLKALGVDLVDLEGWTCCPAFGTMPSLDEEAWAAASVWNLVLAEDKGVDVVTGCGSCYGSPNEAIHKMHEDPALKEKVNAIYAKIGKKYTGTAKMRLLINYLYNEVGVDTIKKAVKHNLNGMVVAVQPGCHTIWPSKAYPESEDDVFHPKWLRELCEALGASAPEYSRLTDCCGMGAMRSVAPDKSLGLFKKKFDTIKDELDAELIVAGCNSCLLQCDAGQKQLFDKKEISSTIPSLHYMQLLALCLGADPKQVTGLSAQNLDSVINKIIGG